MTAHAYEVRLARADELRRVRQIEDESGVLFNGLGLIDETRDPSFPADEAARRIALGQLWMACVPNAEAIGMIIASQHAELAYIDELDVVPQHAKRGLGSRLMAEVFAWARWRGCAAVTLSTFRDVPWNAPFYRRRGFVDLQPAEWTPWMHEIREREAAHGLRVDARVFMRYELTP